MLPRLTSPRLVLRALTLADAAPMQRLASDWDVVRMLAAVPWPYPEGEAAAFIHELLDMGPTDDLAVYGIEARDAGFIGTLAFTPSDRDEDRAPRMGYWLGRPYWGRGYATEAARVALAGHAFGARGASAVAAGVFHDNTASQRVLEKLGFVVEAVSLRFNLARQMDVPHVDMRLTRARFEEGSR